MKAFVKRLEQAELEQVQQRFEPMLQAAGVSYEVRCKAIQCLPTCIAAFLDRTTIVQACEQAQKETQVAMRVDQFCR